MGAVELLLIRHGESAANVAATEARRAGLAAADVGGLRDWDVPLTDAGQRQARALGLWLAGLPADRRPQSAWCSPYVRARQTAELAGAGELISGRASGGGAPGPKMPAGSEGPGLSWPGRPGPDGGGIGAVRVDERLRDREQGVLDLLTDEGIRTRWPEEAARRRLLGRFAYRPPGGESWADVALRLRSLMGDLDAAEDGRRVAVFCHDAVILLLRYVCEFLLPEQIEQIAARAGVRNGSVTRLVRPSGGGPWQVAGYNRVDHLAQGGAWITDHREG
ncbi:2,3-bisphosphoglycerate-dependent phosphoglycerate mutase [Arthrobacter saudimassiliensis]|uniref:2,3-bisphosphoglycerate-dependent phosphoglycerate mutase n=1 Tax=Arthrobacter saudimassiliensis TaxID=1461584 RepID=A0A078MRY4_9MICC|nr:2,3-bisphosphoglycerate-dependent phosphoglycerate mutase [Arthrobacter saudimassiliensis]